MPIRFVVLTDSHYHPRAEKDYGAPKMLTRSREVLDAIPDAVNALEPDFVVHAGDLLCGGSSFNLPTHLYESSVDEVADVLASIKAPFYCVPGNHDCDAQTGSMEAFARRFDLPNPLITADVGPGLRLAPASTYITPAAESKKGWEFGPIHWMNTCAERPEMPSAMAVS